MGELVEELADRPALLFDQSHEVLGSPPAVVGCDAGAAAVIARRAGAEEIRRFPEQVWCRRAWSPVMDACGVAGAARSLDSAAVAVALEDGFAAALPAGGRVAAIAHALEDA